MRLVLRGCKRSTVVLAIPIAVRASHPTGGEPFEALNGCRQRQIQNDPLEGHVRCRPDPGDIFMPPVGSLDAWWGRISAVQLIGDLPQKLAAVPLHPQPFPGNSGPKGNCQIGPV